MEFVTSKSARFLLHLAALFILQPVSTVFACINEIGRSTVGEGISVERLAPAEFLQALKTHEDKTYWRGVLRDLKHIDGRASEIENRNNSAVALLHLGRVAEAIKILERIEKEKPGMYYTATNLGTAYELNGENAKALKWIKEGITRNADAHKGSEWLHVRILEAKLALENDPNWLASNAVIGIHQVPAEQLLSGGAALTDHLGKTRDLKQVEEALIYQLHERLEFIKPPEGVVADLLFDLSGILALTRGPEHSGTIGEFAQTYGPDLTPWSSSGPILPAINVPPPVSTTKYWIAAASAIALVLAIAIIAMLRRRGKTT